MLGEQRLLSNMRQTVEKYKMILDNDVVAVGVSGGKDSLALLYALARYRLFSPCHFQLVAIMIDSGFSHLQINQAISQDPSTSIAAFCEDLHIPLIVEKTSIASIVFEERQEKHPCSLCSKMRRGALVEAATRNGCSKLALGHHQDDAVETFMMNLLFEGRLDCFSPVTHYETNGLTIIRPFIDIPEKDIIYFASHASLPVAPSLCPADKQTGREEIKGWLKLLEKQHKGTKHRIIKAMKKEQLAGF